MVHENHVSIYFFFRKVRCFVQEQVKTEHFCRVFFFVNLAELVHCFHPIDDDQQVSSQYTITLAHTKNFSAHNLQRLERSAVLDLKTKSRNRGESTINQSLLLR